MLEFVVNLSEGRDPTVIRSIAAAAGDCLLDVHSDPDHHRSVLTLGGAAVEDAARAVTVAAVERLDLSHHAGAHPRFGVVDVAPFAPVPDRAHDPGGRELAAAIDARERFGRWAADTLALPCFRYGPERSLTELRRTAFVSVAPDFGPDRPHPTAGACAVGARPPLVAYNVWLDGGDLTLARRIASSIRSDAVRALAFDLAGQPQVSCNLIDLERTGPAEVYAAIESMSADAGVRLARCRTRGPRPRRRGRRDPGRPVGPARRQPRPHNRGAPGPGRALSPE